jgi:hypothetical protein
MPAKGRKAKKAASGQRISGKGEAKAKGAAVSRPRTCRRPDSTVWGFLPESDSAVDVARH